MSHKGNVWYYNPETREEKAVKPPLPPPWTRGRLPYSLWSDEKKQSYRANHKYTEEGYKTKCEKAYRAQKGKVGYTNGTNNIWLRIGEIVPEGYYRGWTIDDPTKYRPRRNNESS